MSLDITRDRQIKFATTREGLPFRRRHDGKCDFSPSPGNIPVQTKRGLEADSGGRKEREKKKEERAGENMTGKSATREAANSQKGYFNLMSVNRITFRLSQAAVAATNTCSSLPLSLTHSRTRDRRLPRFVSFVRNHRSPLPSPLPPRAVTGMLILV